MKLKRDEREREREKKVLEILNGLISKKNLVAALTVFLVVGIGYIIGSAFPFQFNANADSISATALPVSKGGTSANTGPDAILNLGIYPVGSIYISTTSANPGTYLGGTWEAYGTGQALVGINTSNSIMNTAGKTFGVADLVVPYHTHTQAPHTHAINYSLRNPTRTVAGGYRILVWDNVNSTEQTYASWANTQGIATGAYSAGDVAIVENTATNNYAGTSGNATNANYQPSIAVYIWRRTS